MIDTGRQRVLRGDEEIPLPKLSFDLLLALVGAAPNVVSLEALMQQVWPNLVVSPETVSQRVKLLRDALGDDPREPRYIAGLRGRGYRLMVPVTRVVPPPAIEEVQEAPALPAEAVPRASLSVRRRRTVAAVLAALALIVIAAGVIWLRMDSSSRDASKPPPSVTVSALPGRTVAVLPFENLSSKAGDEFMALGIAEGVLHRLSNIKDLTLIARTSSFALRSQPADARDIGLKLNARYLVEGSVQRAGERLRVTAQLIDATTGVHVWSLRFDRTIDDIFEVEDEISQSVARALEVSLGEDEHPFGRYGTEAYLAFLEGRALMMSRKLADAELAIERFSRALELAPQSALAHAALAEAHIFLAVLTLPAVPDRESIAALEAKAEPLLARALQLDSSLGEAYVWRAWLKANKGDTTGAWADYEKGIALSPNYAPGLQQYAEELIGLNMRETEALNLIERARKADPLYPRSHYYKGLLMLDEGSLAEAETLFLQTLRVAPDYYPALHRLGTIRESMGRYAEAVRYSERAVASEPHTVWVREMLSMLYLELNDPEAARYLIAELPDAPREAWIPICLYEKDVERIRDILRAVGIEDLSGNDWPDPYVVRAIRDLALASGDLRARRLMRDLAKKWDPTIGDAKPGEAIWQGDFILVAAQWRKSIGERRSADASARAVLDELDPENAVALAMLGGNDAALAALGDLPGWYDLDREPAFAALRADPRFRALAAKTQEHVSAQRKLLEQMRARGEVPTRAVKGGSSPGGC